MAKLKIYKGFWSVHTCKSEPTALFIFGDNNIKKGKKGQAVIRDCPNSIGIPTKKYPTLSKSAYYTDDEFDENRLNIKIAINQIILLADNYDTIYLPENGIGTGLADLPNVAPKTYKYLQKKIDYLKKNL